MTDPYEERMENGYEQQTRVGDIEGESPGAIEGDFSFSGEDSLLDSDGRVSRQALDIL